MVFVMEAAETAGDGQAEAVEHVGRYDEHGAAERTGFLEGDVLARFGDRAARLSESHLIAVALEHPRGARVPVEVLRGAQRLTLKLPQQ